MSDTSNRSAMNYVTTAATHALDMHTSTDLLGFIAIEETYILQFVLEYEFGDSFGRLFLGYIIIAIIAIGAGVLSLTKAGAAWTRGVAGAGILMTALAVVIIILGKLFS